MSSLPEVASRFLQAGTNFLRVSEIANYLTNNVDSEGLVCQAFGVGILDYNYQYQVL